MTEKPVDYEELLRNSEQRASDAMRLSSEAVATLRAKLEAAETERDALERKVDKTLAWADEAITTTRASEKRMLDRLTEAQAELTRARELLERSHLAHPGLPADGCSVCAFLSPSPAKVEP